MDLMYLLRFVAVQGLGFMMLVTAVGLSGYSLLRGRRSKTLTGLAAGLLIGGTLLVAVVPYGLKGALALPMGLKSYGPADGPAVPMVNIWEFFTKSGRMERVADIARDPNDVPAPVERTAPDRVKVKLTAKEVISKMADGVDMNYWTFNGTAPGPLLRVREGDTVELTITNDKTSLHHHSIDLHGVTGPGGGATVSNVRPGETKSFSFKALNPGLFVYHCAHPNAAVHMAHGMYGLIFVEPKTPLPKVDQEFYVMQGEAYTQGGLGRHGLQMFDAQGMLDSRPQYVVFNGRTGGATGKMKVKTGERVRLYVGNGGVNLTSSFHVIGEIFDTVYPEGSMGPGTVPARNIQTTVVPAGGATIVEFTVDVPGKYILVDHALARLDRGAWATIEATGAKRPDIFDGVADEHGGGH